MRVGIVVALLFGGAHFAWAQSAPETSVVVPPAPPVVAAPTSAAPAQASSAAPSPPGLVQTPVPSTNSAGSAQAPADHGASTDAGAGNNPAANTQAAQQDVAPAISNVWVPAKNAEFGVLNKVDGAITKLAIPVGGQATIGDLQISVQACDNRPPDQLPDSSVFLTLVNTKDNSAPLFRGWMVRSAPAATVVGDADETLRIIGCS